MIHFVKRVRQLVGLVDMMWNILENYVCVGVGILPQIVIQVNLFYFDLLKFFSKITYFCPSIEVLVCYINFFQISL